MKLASIVNKGALLISCFIVCISSANAQREFVDRGNRATAIELGYSTTNDIDGIVGAVGFTGDRDLDLGFGVGKFDVSSSLDIYAFQLGGEYYFVKNYQKNGRFFMSFGAAFLHDWYRNSNEYAGGNRSYSGISIGPSITFGPHGNKAQLVVSGGLRYLDMSNINENDHWVKSVNLAFAFRRTGGAWLGVSSGYSSNDNQGTFSVSLLIVAEKL